MGGDWEFTLCKGVESIALSHCQKSSVENVVKVALRFASIIGQCAIVVINFFGEVVHREDEK
jgi:hypothetical protein